MRIGLTLLTGFSLNSLTIALNRGVMPYSAQPAGFASDGSAVVGHAELHRGHLLSWLVPAIPKVVSIGDLIMIVGLVIVLVSGMAQLKAGRT